MQSELNIKYIRCKTKKYNIYGESLPGRFSLLMWLILDSCRTHKDDIEL